jgi:hypothetical protein
LGKARIFTHGRDLKNLFTLKKSQTLNLMLHETPERSNVPFALANPLRALMYAHCLNFFANENNEP